MKYPFVAPLAAALFLQACVTDPHYLQAWPPPVAEPVAPPEKAPAEKQKPSLSRLISKTHDGMTAAYRNHDPDRFASFFTEDAEAAMPGAADLHGRAQVAAAMKQRFAAISDIKTADVRTFQKGSVQVVESVISGTMTGDFMGLKATKKPVGERRVAVAWFNDAGMVTRWHEYGNVPGMVAQMKGAKDAPPVPEAPDDDVEEHVGRDDGAEDKLADWFKTINDAFNKGDPKTIGEMYATDADATFYFFGGKSFSGKDLTAYREDFAKAFPRARFAVDNAWGIDGFVIAERTMTATHQFPSRHFGEASSSKEVTAHLAEIVFPGDDGKVEHTWTYGNLAELTGPAATAKK